MTKSKRNNQMQFVIDTEARTFSVDGSEPQPYESIEQVCELLEATEQQSPEAGMEQEQQGMEAGFAGVRGGGL
jgi:gamma-glutamylcysteine synthetase